ncbi:MAG: class I SAM-dependent methyltransferase [Pseudodesulfovibrio sp.]
MSAAPEQCRICGAGNDQQTLRADTVFGGRPEHNFWNCSECDAVYLFPIPSEGDEQEFYAREFEKFMATRSGKADWNSSQAHIAMNREQRERRWPFLEDHLSPGMRLLEVGCSSGFMLEGFKKAGVECVGVEPSGVFYEHLQSEGVEVYQSLDDLEAASTAQFDLIVHFFVLEHLRDPFSFFQRSMDLLKAGGKIIAEVPCVNDPLTSVYDIPAFEEFYWSVAHHYYYNPNSLGYILDKLGLKYEMVPEQRYDLSNHMVWMNEGRPGGQGEFNDVFSPELVEKYREDLKDKWLCDTIFLYIYK